MAAVVQWLSEWDQQQLVQLSINTQAAKKWAMNCTHSAMDGSGKTVTLSGVP
jgi:hypothetical protein